ncbi:MAG: 4-hydroxy-tetrahydrodipicolinate synthase [Spirochaetales bacterium]|nr:4-hydroxy-tetrahydrodipicolinate synthase [Spirochaetales bacterium]
MFKGVFTALVTPFTENGDLDEKALRDLVDFQIENKVHGLVPMGTTGESPTVSHEEQNKIIDIVIDQAKNRVPVIAGAGSNSTAEAIRLTKHAKQAGAAATLQVAPYYNKPTQEGFYRHFLAIADTVDLPLIVYNIPGRSGKNIENSTTLKLAQHKNIVGVKEASGDMSQIMDLLIHKPDDFCVLSGDDNLVFSIMALGGHGVVSVASNLIPQKMSAFVELALQGNWAEARKAHFELLPLFKAIFIETNPIPIKAALALKGMLQENYRLPMCPMDPGNKEKLKTVLQELGLL